MARDRVSIDQFPGAVMAQLEEYVSMASDEVKEAVRTVSEDVKAEIQSRAPVKTGKYKKSWTVTKVEETAQSLVNTVHSAKHYRLTHLLENGHAKRGGGRTRSFPHIAPARLWRRRSCWRSRKGNCADEKIRCSRPAGAAGLSLRL